MGPPYDPPVFELKNPGFFEILVRSLREIAPQTPGDQYERFSEASRVTSPGYFGVVPDL